LPPQQDQAGANDAEHKPKQDDQLVGDAKANNPGLGRSQTKPHCDKLKDAVDEAANRNRKER
jgi:hypothetical protein